MDFATYQNLINQSKHRQDNSLSVRFYDKPIKTDKFDGNGIPVFKSVCYCEIRIKDNTTEVFDQPASKEKIDRFPVEYARYQLLKQKLVEGTPLEMFAFLTADEIETCKYRGILTLEGLANITSEQADKINLGKEYLLAKKFMASAKNLKNIVDADDVENKYQAKIAELEEQINNLKKNKIRRKGK